MTLDVGTDTYRSTKVCAYQERDRRDKKLVVQWRWETCYMLAPVVFFPVNNFFPSNWNKPTFAASCSKLLLSIWDTLSKVIVRGSMKFSNSSSSSPTGKESKVAKALDCIHTAVWKGQSHRLLEESLTTSMGTWIWPYRNKNLRFDMFSTERETKKTNCWSRTTSIPETSTSLHFSSFSVLSFSFLLIWQHLFRTLQEQSCKKGMV